MTIGMIGLGRMGMNMALRLLRGGHRVVAYNRSPEKVDEIKKKGALGVYTLEDLIKKLTPPRSVWLMLPAGRPTDRMIKDLLPLMKKGDAIIEGGNSFYRDDIRREKELRHMGINYLDAGVSGGIWGLKNGYCLMIGGDKKVFSRHEPLFRSLAPREGYLHCGSAGAGHFVKMIHNGIEYGMMSSYGEGFDLLKSSSYGEEIDLAKVAHLWNRGSVIRSWLLELVESALKKDSTLSDLKGYVEDSGEGRWTVQQAVETAVPAPVITAALYQRFRSRQGGQFSDKLLAALRNEFGGHAVKNAGKKTA